MVKIKCNKIINYFSLIITTCIPNGKQIPTGISLQSNFIHIAFPLAVSNSIGSPNCVVTVPIVPTGISRNYLMTFTFILSPFHYTFGWLIILLNLLIWL